MIPVEGDSEYVFVNTGIVCEDPSCFIRLALIWSLYSTSLAATLCVRSRQPPRTAARKLIMTADGMDYEICYSPRNPLCHGGDNEVDHVSPSKNPY